jgi:hypothetical protein
VEGLPGHVDGRRRRDHAEGRGAMRVEDNVQTPSRDHPGRRRLMRVEDDGMCRRRRPTPPASAGAQVWIVVGYIRTSVR